MKHVFTKSRILSLALMISAHIFGVRNSAFAQTPIYSQDFSYSGALTANGWTAHSGGGTNAISTTSGLTYNGHAGSGVGNAVLLSNAGGEDDNITFASQSTNGASVYASFLVNITDAATAKTGDYFFHLGSPGGAAWTAFSSRVFARIVSGNVNFGLSNTSTATYGTTNFSKNTTYLIVLKYTIATGTTADPVSMWVLTGMPTTEALAGTAEVANTTTNGTDAISAIGLRQGSSTTSVQTVVDAIRVGSTWTSVVPLSASAPSTQAYSISFSAATSSQVTASWLSGNGDGRLVKINTTNSFTNPTSGQSYTANATYGGSGEQVVSVGNTNSATVSNLVPGQTYYFRAYEYTSTGWLYNTNTATDNPNSTTLSYPTPVLTSLSPTSAFAGGSSFTLTVTGTGFYPASVVNWNGSPRTTTYVNSTTLTSAITTADIATTGTVDVTVTNPAPGGGTSSNQTFTINISASPLISVSSSLSSFTTVAGTPSASQSYTVAGSNLTDDITITPPAGFEIRTGASAFSSAPLVLTQTGGVVSATTIDIRFSPAVSGSASGSVVHTSSGATTQSVSVNGFALADEPALPSAITFGAVTGNSIVVNTAGGSGASRIIVVRQATAVGYTPNDGASVSGVNASFTSALDQGAGDKIVYDGTGNTVTVTNLSSQTPYYFAVYEYNGSGVTANYQITGAGTAMTTTLAAEPTTACSLSTTRLKTDTCVIGVTGGNGANRIFIISTSPVTFSPADATTYPFATGNLAGAAGVGPGNFVIYNGAASTPVVLSGLSAGTTYYVQAFDYNGSSTLTNYRTSTFGSLTFTTPSNIVYNGGTYTQDFNGLPSNTSGSYGMTGFNRGPYYLSTPTSNATGMTGWQHASIAGSGTDLVFNVENGSSTTGATKSYGATGSTNRALGSLAAGGCTPAFGAVFVNNTGGPLTSITLSYTGQQWRNGGSGTPNKLYFSYAIGSSDITTGVFSTEASLEFQNPISGGATAALDGTQPGNQTSVSGTVALNANWLPGQTLAIRWLDNNDAGSDDGLAIDDLSFSAAGPTTPLAQDSSLFFLNALTTSMDVNWSSGDGAARLVLINTTNSFTDPVDGQTYTANTAYSGSGQQVVFNGNGNVVHVDGLTAGTTYYFRVYGYNGFGASTKYNTSTALDNPSSFSTAAPSAATKLVITSVNGYADPVTGMPFSVIVQAQDSAGSPQTVSLPTTVSLSVSYGAGTLSGTTSGVIPAGSSSVTITGVIYSPEDYGVQLQADATAGETLAQAVSYPFNVLGVASQLFFLYAPPSGILNTPLATVQVQALRNDYTQDPNFNGTITLTKLSGPGNLVGTTSVPAVGGLATFSNISFDAPGTYELEASSGGLASAYSSSVVITLSPSMTELVVPKYIAGKTAAGAHNARVPFAVCLKIDNLVPNTAYDIKAGVDTLASSSYGAGNTWIVGTGFTVGTIANAFTTDATGSSGPFWVYLQPTANSTTNRFTPGVAHNLRVGFAPTGGVMPASPNFIGTKLMTALDIGTTALTTATTDDGAFLTGTSTGCVGGKFILLYDNASGSGDPISVYQSRVMTAPNTFSQTELPTLVNDIYLQGSTAIVGDYAALIPIGANNANGIRRIEVRNADNTVFNAATDADGVWSASVNTTTIARRSVASLTPAEAPLSTLSFTASSTGESCTGTADGTATVNLVSGTAPVTYSWNTTPAQTTATATGLSAGTYTVSVTDANGCSQTATATVAAPASATITAGGPTTFCNGGSVTLSVGTANSYLWSNGATTQSIVVTTGGSYSVTVTDGTCNATSLPVGVTVLNYQFNGTLFSENMGTPSVNTSVNSYTGWQNTAPVTFNAGTTSTDVRITTVSTGYTGASGGGNVFFGTTNGNLKTLTVSGINTQGYSSLVLSYGLLRSDITNQMTVEVSTDGVNFTALTAPQPTTANAWQLMTINSGIPATSNLRIRFSKNVSTSFRLDDIKITGTTGTPSIAVTGSTTVCGAGSITLYSNVPSGLVWSYNGSTARRQTASDAGSYTYTATDANGCSATAAPVVFTINPEPTATITAGTISCFGGTTTLNVSASTGTAPYTNTGTFTVSAGTYNYIVTDAAGCDDTVSTTVTQPAAITGSASVSACSSYTWSLNGTTYTQSGSYTATGIAANGCDSTATLNLTIIPSTTNTSIAVACDSYTWQVNGNTYTQSGTYSSVSGCTTQVLLLTVNTTSTNTSTVTACGSYTWAMNGQTYTQSGSYTSTSNCTTSILNLTVTTFTATISTTDVTCNGLSNGTAGVTVGSCNSTFTYLWSTGATTPQVTGLASGTYSVTVSDQYGHSSTLSATITEPPAIEVIMVNGEDITCGNTSDGYINIFAIGGSGTLQYSIDGGITYQTSSAFVGLLPGTYVTYVRDATNCPVLAGTVVLNAPTNCNTGITLNLTAFIEGYYIGTNAMTSVLANQGVSGTIGTETDTLMVELRDSLDPTIVVDVQPMLLMTDGTASATFSSASAGTSYWIAVRHRNSIQTWSAAPVLTSATTSYDFTTSASQAFGDNMKEVETGVFAFFTGDINQDEFVDPYDYPDYAADNVNFAMGYMSTDFNGDGFVDPYDYPVYAQNNVNFIMSMHP